MLSLRIGNISLQERTVIPRKGYDGAKNTWVTFLNEEAAQAVRRYIPTLRESDPETGLFRRSDTRLRRAFKRDYETQHDTAPLCLARRGRCCDP